ncbi:MAG: diacylglycerol O-acyltransferase / wax synthase [Pseudonocardiales bacterium]|nr:diacylglycerol O-acyltransferase / wax synthase [Pseudonocardiales bacterium]
MSAADVSFLYLEARTEPQHVGSIAVFAMPPGGFDYDRLVRLLDERISCFPRYRQRIRAVPGHIANPVWADDAAFDITYHVRRSALPRPGTDAQLLEFAARIHSRLLDRARPLWELYLVEGLAGDRLAVITKTHHAMVDGVGAVDVAQVILDELPRPRRTVEALWMPEPEPSGTALVLGAVADVVRRPAAVTDTVRLALHDARAAVGKLGKLGTVGASAAGLVSSATALVRHSPPAPLRATLGQQRRIAIARTRLDDYREVRRVHGGSVNDVVLATVTGALRGWLTRRDVPLAPSMTVRALVPMSVLDDPRARPVRSRVTGTVVDLPVGEPAAVRRLERLIAASMAHRQSGRSVPADALSAITGLAPPTMHALGARVAHGLTHRPFDVVVTNVPGPQVPLYAAGARMTEMFPIVPLNPGHAMGIGLTSYDGGVYYGLDGDRDTMPDLAEVAQLIEQSLAELVRVSPHRHGPVRPSSERSTRRRNPRRSATPNPREPQR